MKYTINTYKAALAHDGSDLEGGRGSGDLGRLRRKRRPRSCPALRRFGLGMRMRRRGLREGARRLHVGGWCRGGNSLWRG